MRYAAVVLALLAGLAIGSESGPARPVSLELQVEPDAPIENFQWVLVDIAPAVNGSQTLHCRGRPVKEFARAAASRNAKGQYEWKGILPLGDAAPGPKDSLALCAVVEGGRLKHLWSSGLVSAKGGRLSRVQCWVGSGLELDCTAFH